MITDWSTVKWFKAFEFDSPDTPGSGSLMDADFVRKLDLLREACKCSLIINSGYRTSLHNATVKDSVDGSAHTTGHAVDIQALGSVRKFTILEAALRLGFRRIGVGATFLHLDDDITKPQDVVWTYASTRTT